MENFRETNHRAKRKDLCVVVPPIEVGNIHVNTCTGTLRQASQAIYGEEMAAPSLYESE
jgi:hypothetical protein